MKSGKSDIVTPLAGVRWYLGFTPFPKEFPHHVGAENSVPLTPGTLKKGESMNAVLALATVVLAVVAVLEYIRRQAK